MLLTSAQVSAAISSGIVCVFTTILFFSGYALQQRTVRDIHDVIHPKIVPVTNNVDQSPIIPDRKQQILAAHGLPEINWKRVAYARSVRNFDEVCEAVMLFAELTAQKSRAQKVLLYPAEWDSVVESGYSATKAFETSVRLLHKAAKQFRVAVVPIKTTQNYHQRDRISSDLINFLALSSFERIIYLAPKGLVLDAEILDSLFGAPMNLSVATLDGAHAKPSQSLLIQTSPSLSKRPMIDEESFAGPILSGRNLSTIIFPSSYLRRMPKSVNISLDADTFYDSTGYLRFTDADVIGPEFDLEKGTFIKAQPSDPDMQIIWRNSYDRFRLMRMNYCGLDLQPMGSDGPEQLDEL